jgi:hypothetical protein
MCKDDVLKTSHVEAPNLSDNRASGTWVRFVFNNCEWFVLFKIIILSPASIILCKADMAENGERPYNWPQWSPLPRPSRVRSVRMVLQPFRFRGINDSR